MQRLLNRLLPEVANDKSKVDFIRETQRKLNEKEAYLNEQTVQYEAEL